MCRALVDGIVLVVEGVEPAGWVDEVELGAYRRVRAPRHWRSRENLLTGTVLVVAGWISTTYQGSIMSDAEDAIGEPVEFLFGWTVILPLEIDGTEIPFRPLVVALPDSVPSKVLTSLRSASIALGECSVLRWRIATRGGVRDKGFATAQREEEPEAPEHDVVPTGSVGIRRLEA